MRPAIAAALVLAAMAGAAVPITAAPGKGRAAGNLCAGGETVVYSCRFGTKLGSVCAGQGRVHYRFGAKGRPEMALSSQPDFGNVHVGMVTGQQGGRQRHVRFTSGVTHYVVFEGVDGQLADRPGRTYSGIAVLSADREQATLSCRGGATITPGFTVSVIAQAPAERRTALEETPGGPFDAWF